MINDIDYKGNKLVLRKSESVDKNIFDVDSLTLIIGKNGSGKTQLLKSIAENLTNNQNISFASDSKINFASGDESERKQWGCLYFSPVPFRAKFERRNRFSESSGTLIPRVKMFDILEYEDIIKRLGISLKVSAFSPLKIRVIIHTLIDVIMSKGDFNNDKSLSALINLFDFGSLVEFNNQSKDTSIGISIQRRRLAQPLVAEIISWLHGNFKKSEMLSFFIYFYNRQRGSQTAWSKYVLESFIKYFTPTNELLKEHSEEYLSHLEEIRKIAIFLEVKDDKGDVDIEDDELNVILSLPGDESILDDFQVGDYFKVHFNRMSSGQQAIVSQFVSIANSLKRLAKYKVKKALILIDEGDAYLHLEWQRMYISILNDFLCRLKKEVGMDSLQVILATHSPLLATDVPKEFVYNLDKGDAEKQAFSSPMHILLSESFGAKNIGEFASESINTAIRNLYDGRVTIKDISVIDAIDNSVMKKEIYRIFSKVIPK